MSQLLRVQLPVSGRTRRRLKCFCLLSQSLRGQGSSKIYFSLIWSMSPPRFLKERVTTVGWDVNIDFLCVNLVATQPWPFTKSSFCSRGSAGCFLSVSSFNLTIPYYGSSYEPISQMRKLRLKMTTQLVAVKPGFESNPTSFFIIEV